MAFPIKNNLLDKDAIFAIYVVLDDSNVPVYVVAVTASGPKIEPASSVILGLLQSYKKEVVYLSMVDFVMHFHHANSLHDIKSRIRYSI